MPKRGLDIVEISSGFITNSTEDWLRLVEKVQKAGLKAKPEVGIQFGAGGATEIEELKAEGTRDPEWAISQAKRFLEAGAYMVMIESEGITAEAHSGFDRKTEVGAAGGSPVARGRPPRGAAESAERSSASAAAVVGLALRFALNASPCGLRRASLRARPTTKRRTKTKTKKGTFLMR